MVLTQLGMLFLIPCLPWMLTMGLAYCFGGVINHSLMLGIFNQIFCDHLHQNVLILPSCRFYTAIHEISHSRAFGYNKPTANRIAGILANLPIGIPFSVSFKKYHMEHHRVN